MATSLKALKEQLPIPSLAEWFLSHPEHVQNLYERHSKGTDGKCMECGTPADCKFFVWATEAQEYLVCLENRNRIKNGRNGHRT